MGGVSSIQVFGIFGAKPLSILQTAHSRANTFLSGLESCPSTRLECGVHDRLHIYPLCGIFYFPWHRHRVEGTNGF